MTEKTDVRSSSEFFIRNLKMSLKPTQIKAAALLAQGWQCQAVAKEVGVTPQTISDWKRNSEFEAYVNTIAMESLAAARSYLQGLAETAVKNLEELMTSAESETIRLKATLAVLGHIGFTDPQTGLYGWGVGSTSPEAIDRKKAKAESIAKFGMDLTSALGSYS